MKRPLLLHLLAYSSVHTAMPELTRGRTGNDAVFHTHQRNKIRS